MLPIGASRMFGSAMRCMPLAQYAMQRGAGYRPLRALGTTRTVHDTSADDINKNRAPAIRRFWRNVSVGEKDGALVVLLDARAVKTPGGTPMRISARQPALAWLVAGEWESQKEFLGAHSLPLTSLVSRAIDGLSDASVRADVITKLLKYFHTDSVCLHDNHPRVLAELQERHYAPIAAWARSTYGIDIKTTTDMFVLRQTPEAADRLRAVVEGFSDLKLAALERAVMTAKSFLIALALVEQHVSVEDAACAAQVEATAQTQLWGELENAHDLDNAAMRQILGASACAALNA
ncbi:chaperone [Coemansia sp. RSA 1807]|nr:chaperone [Coemansia sp. RSA 1591]KAJ1763864.1 chaperone [Coemansia sp. RSA 1752]KAJ1788609.1 chaperone [Coemansia sp. RSA 2167]KAJ2280198.1 chaperone [Coemansia sp. RSA 451]KAJ2576236.1 chaperone [Coemansia sp. RSA 1807]KAJ2583069.1 chaperone [Coemansia sp. RSA 1797]